MRGRHDRAHRHASCAPGAARDVLVEGSAQEVRPIHAGKRRVERAAKESVPVRDGAGCSGPPATPSGLLRGPLGLEADKPRRRLRRPVVCTYWRFAQLKRAERTGRPLAEVCGIDHRLMVHPTSPMRPSARSSAAACPPALMAAALGSSARRIAPSSGVSPPVTNRPPSAATRKSAPSRSMTL